MMEYFLGAAAAAAAAVGAAGYQSIAPTGQWYGRTFTGLERGSKKLALTYDDGPNDPHTMKLLDVLAKHSVRATFFMIGRFVQQRPQIARAVAQAGHVIGNHTFTHPNLIFVSALQARMQIEECERALHDTVGEHSKLFRPPFGGLSPPRACDLFIDLHLHRPTISLPLPNAGEGGPSGPGEGISIFTAPLLFLRRGYRGGRCCL